MLAARERKLKESNPRVAMPGLVFKTSCPPLGASFHKSERPDRLHLAAVFGLSASADERYIQAYWAAVEDGYSQRDP